MTKKRNYVFLGSSEEESAAIRMRFPTKIPVSILTPSVRFFSPRNFPGCWMQVFFCLILLQIIVERYSKEMDLPQLEKRKFLVPQEFTMSQFISIIRSRMRIGPNKAIFFLVNNRSLVSLSKSLAEIYAENRSDDGFLYINYASQEVFGWMSPTTMCQCVKP